MWIMKIRIDWLTDTCDCDTCGPSYAEGAVVYFDDVEVLKFRPSAHCFDGENYSREYVYQAIIKHLEPEAEFDD